MKIMKSKYGNLPTSTLIYRINKYEWLFGSDNPPTELDIELNRRVPNEIKEYDQSGNLIDKVMAGYDDDGNEVWI